jgi:hypothetical protein
LTLPDESFCEDVTEFARRAKSWLDAYFKRLRRAVPGVACLWRIEWQDRKTGKFEGRLCPHFHLLVWGLCERKTGEHIVERETGRFLREDFEPFVQVPDLQLPLGFVELCEQGGFGRFGVDVAASVWASQNEPSHPRAGLARCMGFQEWSSLAWYQVVESGNLGHLAAGCRVERVRTWGGVMSYCAKYLGKIEPLVSETNYGRSWGFHNRKLIPWAKMIDIDLSEDNGVRLRRVMRRYLEHKTCRPWRCRFGITVYCDVTQFRRLWEVPSNPDPF